MDDVAQLDRGANRAQGVVLSRDRNPKNGHHGVTDELLHRPPVTLEHHPRCLVVPVHQGPQRLRVRAVTDRRRACQVAEEDRHDLSHLTLGRRRERSAAARTKPEPVRTLATAPGADDHREESMPGQRELAVAHVEPSRDRRTRHVGLAGSTSSKSIDPVAGSARVRLRERRPQYLHGSGLARESAERLDPSLLRQELCVAAEELLELNARWDERGDEA